MPFDSEGNFTRVHNWEEDRQNDIDIVSDRHDEEDDNFANGFNDCMLRDGRSVMTGDLDMGNFKVKKVAKGTVSTDAVNKSQLDEVNTSVTSALKTLLNKLWKIGDIKASVKDANHDNWFLCNGQAINRVTYSELFTIIGTKFGQGDGTTTFNLPDYRGKFLRGLGGNSASDIYTTQEEGLPNITGWAQLAQAKWEGGPDAYAGALKIDSGVNNKIQFSAGGGWDGTGRVPVSFDAARSSAIYGKSTHVTPVNQAVNYFIKVKEEA